MRSFYRWITFLSPWVALGLAAALWALYVHPTWLSSRSERLVNPSASPPAAAATSPTLELGPTPTQVAPPHSVISSYADAVAHGAPAVVNISTHRVVIERQVPEQVAPFFPDWPEFRRREESSRGSGVILDAAGHIATNYHVIKGMQDIVVQLTDGRSAPAQRIGTDPDTDLAILQIKLPNLPVMPLGRSDSLRVGDVVLAIGNSAGLGQTVTQGIVSATGRSQLGLALLENFIQTDAAINPGNSGGALINTAGELIGINTAILNREQGIEGIGFAIPVNLVRGVASELESKGRILRGWVGIGVRSLPANLTDQRGQVIVGVQVTGFFPESPARLSGLRPGDLILRLDGKPVTDVQGFLSVIARKSAGSQATVDILRLTGERLSITLPVIAQPVER
jgi:serine protease DegS